jgi:hypothetical protein
LLLLVGLYFLALTNPALASTTIRLTPVSTNFNNPIGVDYYEPTNKVLLSVNYPNGEPNNFDLVGSDGTHSPFTSVHGLGDEVYIATVRSSACHPGFQVGESFTGNGQPGQIVRISPDGSIQDPWVTLPGETGLLAGGLFQDRYCTWGGDLIVTTRAGNVWRVTGGGVATMVGHVDGASFLEGPTTIPDDSAKYGPWSGNIVVADETSGCVYSVDHAGTSSCFMLGMGGPPESVRVIDANENFFGVDYSDGKVLGAEASQFADIAGDILLADESPGLLIHVHWNGTTFETEQVAQVTQWEGTTFAPAGIPPIPPVTGGTGWQPLGPGEVTYAPGSGKPGPYNGRVTALAVDRNNPASEFGTSGSLYVGTNGGVFATHDSGKNWISSPQGGPGAVSSLVVDGSGRIYAGTGRPFAETFIGQPGEGVFFSEDGGSTWSRARSVDSKTGAQEFAGKTIYGLTWDKNSNGTDRNQQHLFAAADGGIYESHDGGDTWTNVEPANYAWAVTQDPGNPAKFWAAVTFGQCNGGLLTLDPSKSAQWQTGQYFKSKPGVTTMRVSLAVTENDDAYAAVSGCDGFGLAGGWLFETTHGGDAGTWHQHYWDCGRGCGPYDPFANPPAGKRFVSQGSFDNVIAADPKQGGADCNAVVMGIRMFSIDRCHEHVDIVNDSANDYVHEDGHAMIYGGRSQYLWVGTDGGLYYSHNGGQNWVQQNNFATQASGGALLSFGGGYDDATGFAVSALQDNGLVKLNSDGSGQSVFSTGNDSFGTVLDANYPQHPDTIYVQHYYASLYRIDPSNMKVDPGSSTLLPCNKKATFCPSPATLFTAPLALAPSASGQRGSVFIGDDRLRYSTDRGVTWQDDPVAGTKQGVAMRVGVPKVSDCVSISKKLKINPAPGHDCISALAVDPATSSSTRPLVLVGTDMGRLLLRTSSGLSDVAACTGNGKCLPVPSTGTKVSGLPWITAVAVRTDTATGAVEAWAAFGRATSPGRIYYSPDLNATNRTWVPVDPAGVDPAGHLPDEAPGMVVHALALDPNKPNLLYAGTDFGVDACTGCGGQTPAPQWKTAASGLPRVAVTRLTLSSEGKQLLAATHGRGLWSLGL